MPKDIIARSLVEKCLDVNGPFKFSHLEYASPIRFNVDKLQYVFEISHLVISELSSLFGELTSVGGVASGGDPWAMGLSTLHNIPWFSVKKDGNVLGTIYGERVGLIEDVVTTGGSLDSASLVLKRRSFNPILATIFNYGLRRDIPNLINFEDVYPYFLGSVSDNKLKEIDEWYGHIKNST